MYTDSKAIHLQEHASFMLHRTPHAIFIQTNIADLGLMASGVKEWPACKQSCSCWSMNRDQVVWLLHGQTSWLLTANYLFAIRALLRLSVASIPAEPCWRKDLLATYRISRSRQNRQVGFFRPEFVCPLHRRGIQVPGIRRSSAELPKLKCSFDCGARNA